MTVRTAALVGVAGGAGTTRTAVELAGALAGAGRSALVFDLDFATQGLSQSAPGRIDPDATALLTDPDLAVDDVAIDWETPGDGRLAVVPSHAPFVDVANAMTTEAAERVGDRLREATGTFDHVVVDVPPIASNPAIAGVDAADRVAAVFPPTDRGVDSLQRAKGRLEDVGSDLDLQIAARAAPEDAPADADAVIPELPAQPAPDQPTTLAGGGPAVASAMETAATLFETDLPVESSGGAASVVDGLKRRVSSLQSD